MNKSSEFDDGEDRVTKASLTIYLLVNWGRAQTWQGHSLQTSLLEVGNKANLVKGLQLLPRPAKLSSTGGQNGNFEDVRDYWTARHQLSWKPANQLSQAAGWKSVEKLVNFGTVPRQ